MSIRTNQFVYSQTDKCTPQQQELHDYIKSMHDRGMSYRQITKLLNEKNIPTHKGKKWGVIWKLCLFCAQKISTKREERLIEVQKVEVSTYPISWCG